MKKSIRRLFFIFSFGLLFFSCRSFKTTEPIKDVGLMLSGGGAKGAYEVGCYRALEEYGIARKIGVISGTSVGALNGALFACSSSQEAENLWKNDVGFSSFLEADLDSIGKFASNAFSNEIEKTNTDNMNDIEIFGTGLWGVIKNTGELFFNYITDDKSADGLCDRTYTEQLIEKNISLDKLNERKISVYATCLEKKDFLGSLFGSENGNLLHRFLLNEQQGITEIRDILLASSAIPGIYPTQSLGTTVLENGKFLDSKKEFIDGGFEMAAGDNSPLEPILNHSEIKTIIAVYLDSNSVVKSCNNEEIKLVNIVPSKNIGDFISGAMNFSTEKITTLIELGYEDTCRVLEHNGFCKGI